MTFTPSCPAVRCFMFRLMAFTPAVILSSAIMAAEPATVAADAKVIAGTIDKVIQAAGGKEKLLTLFRIKEKLVIGSEFTGKTGTDRVSVLEPPQHWWLGKKDRVKEDKEPAIFLVWIWTLAPLTDPATKVEALPDLTDDGVACTGLRISGTVTPAMDVYFNKQDHRLVRVDWRTDFHRFDDWKELDGLKYPARTTGYKKASGKPWYQTNIVEVTRLTELPEGLSR